MDLGDSQRILRDTCFRAGNCQPRHHSLSQKASYRSRTDRHSLAERPVYGLADGRVQPDDQFVFSRRSMYRDRCDRRCNDRHRRELHGGTIQTQKPEPSGEEGPHRSLDHGGSSAIVVFTFDHSRLIRPGFLSRRKRSAAVRSIGVHENLCDGVFYIADTAPAADRDLLDLPTPYRRGEARRNIYSMVPSPAEKSAALQICLYGNGRPVPNLFHCARETLCRRFPRATRATRYRR